MFVYPLRSSEDDPKASLNQHQSLSGEILPHFDINNLSVAQKLKQAGAELCQAQGQFGFAWFGLA